MDYRLILSLHAEQDIDEIIRYIAINLSNKKAASDFLDKLETKLTKLSANPKLHQLSRHDALAQKGYRHFMVDNYVVFYLVDDVLQTIKIARILYGRRDYLAIL